MNADTAMAGKCLTNREAEVLRLLARGRSYEQASDALGVTLHTVRSHVKNLYRKLGVRSARAAVWKALELGLLGGPSAPEGRFMTNFKETIGAKSAGTGDALDPGGHACEVPE